MAGARERDDWLRMAKIAVPLYEQLRDTKTQFEPFTLHDFYPWPNELPEQVSHKVKPSEIF